MTIVKKKAKKKNFSIIDNEGLHSRLLSWQATGLWAWFMSKPDDWEVNLENLCSSKTNGRDSTLSTLAELEDAGYLIYQRWRNSTGRFESAYTVFESPEQLEEWKEDAPPEELNSIAKVSKNKGRKKTTVGKPQWENHSGKTTVGNPQWLNRSGLTTTENPQQLNIDKQSTELPKTELQSTELLNSPNPLQKEAERRERNDFELSSLSQWNLEASSPEKDSSTHIAVKEQKSSVAMVVKTKSSPEDSYSAESCDNTGISPRLQRMLDDYYNNVVTVIPDLEKQEIAKHLIGKELVAKYRRSGRILHKKPNDLNPDFLRFIAWYRWDSDDLTKAADQILSTERSIEKWGHLQTWVEEWESHVANPEKIEMESQRRRNGGKKAPQNQVDKAIAHSQLDKMKQEAEQIYRNLGLPVELPVNDYNYDF